MWCSSRSPKNSFNAWKWNGNQNGFAKARIASRCSAPNCRQIPTGSTSESWDAGVLLDPLNFVKIALQRVKFDKPVGFVVFHRLFRHKFINDYCFNNGLPVEPVVLPLLSQWVPYLSIVVVKCQFWSGKRAQRKMSSIGPRLYSGWKMGQQRHPYLQKLHMFHLLLAHSTCCFLENTQLVSAVMWIKVSPPTQQQAPRVAWRGWVSFDFWWYRGRKISTRAQGYCRWLNLLWCERTATVRIGAPHHRWAATPGESTNRRGWRATKGAELRRQWPSELLKLHSFLWGQNLSIVGSPSSEHVYQTATFHLPSVARPLVSRRCFSRNHVSGTTGSNVCRLISSGKRQQRSE